MGNEIQLDGAEISIIKALGLGGNEISGEELMGKCADIQYPELSELVKALIETGYVESDSYVMHNKELFEKAKFYVNSGYAKDLKDAMDPREEVKKSKRVRRE